MTKEVLLTRNSAMPLNRIMENGGDQEFSRGEDLKENTEFTELDALSNRDKAGRVKLRNKDTRRAKENSVKESPRRVPEPKSQSPDEDLEKLIAAREKELELIKAWYGDRDPETIPSNEHTTIEAAIAMGIFPQGYSRDAKGPDTAHEPVVSRSDAESQQVTSVNKPPGDEGSEQQGDEGDLDAEDQNNDEELQAEDGNNYQGPPHKPPTTSQNENDEEDEEEDSQNQQSDLRGMDGATPENPIDAVWKNKDNDVPIKVTGSLGVGSDGREYMSIEGSNMGVPRDEIDGGSIIDDASVGSEEDKAARPQAENADGNQEPPNKPPTPPEGPVQPEDEPEEPEEESPTQRLERLLREHGINEENIQKLIDAFDDDTRVGRAFRSAWVDENADDRPKAFIDEFSNELSGSNMGEAEEAFREWFDQTNPVENEEAEADGAGENEPPIRPPTDEDEEESDEEDREKISEAKRKEIIKRSKELLADLSWTSDPNITDPTIKDILDLLREHIELGRKNISTGALANFMSRIENARLEGHLVSDEHVKELVAKLSTLFYGSYYQENPGSRRSKLEREVTYEPPPSLEDLIEYSIEKGIVAPEYRYYAEDNQNRRKSGSRPLLYEHETHRNGKPTKDVRVNFENFTNLIHGLATEREGVLSRRGVDYFDTLKFKYGYNTYTGADLFLFTEQASLFLPRRGAFETDEEYKAREEMYADYKSAIGADLYGRQSARQKHTAIEFESGVLGSDSKYQDVIEQQYRDNVFTESTNFQDQLNLSSPLSYSPEKMEERAGLQLIIDSETSSQDQKERAREDLERLDDNLNGKYFRMGISIFAHINDYDALENILGKDSAFFHRNSKGLLSRLGLSKEGRGFVNGFDREIDRLQRGDGDWFDANGVLMSDKLIDRGRNAGKSVKSQFINQINIFNRADKAKFLVETVQFRVTCALAEKTYEDMKGKYQNEIRNLLISRGVPQDEQFDGKVDEELYKYAFETAKYASTNAYYWTSFTGINTGDNDPNAAAFRARAKIDQTFLWFNKQFAKDRGQFPGNQFLMAGINRLSTSMINSIRTKDGRSMIDIIEGRGVNGRTDEFSFGDRVDNIQFSREAMSNLAQNHVIRVFGLFRDITDAKELSFDKFISRDPSPLSQGKLVFNKEEAQKFFSKLKDWRYIFNEIDMSARIRAMVGVDEKGDYIYKDMTIAESFFSKELLHEFIATEDRTITPAVGTGREPYKIKKGVDIDPDKLSENKSLVWKAFMKYFIAAQLFEHRQPNEQSSQYTFKELAQIRGFLRNLPAEFFYGEERNPKERDGTQTIRDFTNRKMSETEIKEFFLSDPELAWIFNKGRANLWKVGGSEFAYLSSAGLVEGGWKTLLLLVGMGGK